MAGHALGTQAEASRWLSFLILLMQKQKGLLESSPLLVSLCD